MELWQQTNRYNRQPLTIMVKRCVEIADGRLGENATEN